MTDRTESNLFIVVCIAGFLLVCACLFSVQSEECTLVMPKELVSGYIYETTGGMFTSGETAYALRYKGITPSGKECFTSRRTTEKEYNRRIYGIK